MYYSILLELMRKQCLALLSQIHVLRQNTMKYNLFKTIGRPEKREKFRWYSFRSTISMTVFDQLKIMPTPWKPGSPPTSNCSSGASAKSCRNYLREWNWVFNTALITNDWIKKEVLSGNSIESTVILHSETELKALVMLSWINIISGIQSWLTVNQYWFPHYLIRCVGLDCSG